MRSPHSCQIGWGWLVRVKNLGAYTRVSISESEVRAFKAQWPASGLPSRSIWFEFQTRNGDITDYGPSSLENAAGAAVNALAADAKEYAGL